MVEFLAFQITLPLTKAESLSQDEARLDLIERLGNALSITVKDFNAFPDARIGYLGTAVEFNG